MTMPEWEIDNWLFGKVKRTITSPLATNLRTKPMLLRMLTMEILKEFGPTFTTHTVSLLKELLVLLNMEMQKLKEFRWTLLIPPLNTLDLFWEVKMKTDTLPSMVFLQE